jgi:4-amino-4-deoxy-L-arabinose transferase-like glycosyltransferase
MATMKAAALGILLTSVACAVLSLLIVCQAHWAIVIPFAVFLLTAIALSIATLFFYSAAARARRWAGLAFASSAVGALSSVMASVSTKLVIVNDVVLHFELFSRSPETEKALLAAACVFATISAWLLSNKEFALSLANVENSKKRIEIDIGDLKRRLICAMNVGDLLLLCEQARTLHSVEALKFADELERIISQQRGSSRGFMPTSITNQRPSFWFAVVMSLLISFLGFALSLTLP